MADGAEYPKALYRDGGSELIWGHPVKTLIARTAVEEREALASGWRLHPIREASDEAIQDEPPKRRGRPPKLRTEHGSA